VSPLFGKILANLRQRLASRELKAALLPWLIGIITHPAI
jgi:hypothetical protein